jgi:hypothetical protein
MPKKREPPKSEKKKHTAVYFTLAMLRRLGHYQADKIGSLRGRNEVIIQAVDAFLKKEGY